VTGSGANNVVGGFVALNAGMIDPSFSTGLVSSGPNSIVGAFAGSNGPFANLPPNLDPNQSFPGTIDPGSKSNNPGNTPQIGTNNASPGNAGLPSIFPPCGATTCQVIIVGLEQQPDKNTGLTFDPQQPPPNQQVAPPTNTNDNNTIQINLTIGGPT